MLGVHAFILILMKVIFISRIGQDTLGLDCFGETLCSIEKIGNDIQGFQGFS